jgi:hypothetical protein
MKRVAILTDYVIQFAGRGLIVGAIFSGLMFAALMLGSLLAGGAIPPHWLLIIPGGTFIGVQLGAMIGFIDGLLVGVIASTFLKTCKALSGIVASISTLGLLIGGFYLIAAPSDLFVPMIVVFWVVAMFPVLMVAGVTGWEITEEHEYITERQTSAA